MKDLLQAYGWEEVISKNPYMDSYKKDEWRMNLYHSGTVQLQSTEGKQIIKREVFTPDELEIIITSL